MKNVSFKVIGEADLKFALDIYNHYIITTTATFRPDKIPMETFKRFIYTNHQKYVAYLILDNKVITGFCFLTQYKNLTAYDRTVEIGVYIKPEFIHNGLGMEAVNYLEKVATAKGFKIIISSISGENIASINMFRKLNYQECGHFKNVGEKFGRILDVIYFQKSLEL